MHHLGERIDAALQALATVLFILVVILALIAGFVGYWIGSQL